jgi:iron-sulfur cluster repair protein YtfE (RIC family)
VGQSAWGHRTPFTPFENFHAALIQVHGELRQQASAILADVTGDRAARTPVDRMIADFCEELENHHRSEDVFFFPAFRAAGRLRSTDIAFLDVRDDEHAALVRLIGELRQATERARGENLARTRWRGSVQRLITELSDIASPHFAAEESVLTAGHVAEMISAPELVDVYKDMGMNWFRR